MLQPREVHNYIKDSRSQLEIVEANFPVVKSRELPLPELLFANPLFCFLTKPLVRLTKSLSVSFKRPFTRSWQIAPPSWLPTGSRQLSVATASQLLTTERSSKKVPSQTLLPRKTASLPTWLTVCVRLRRRRTNVCPFLPPNDCRSNAALHESVVLWTHKKQRRDWERKCH